MRLDGISIIGWIHSVACLVALILGAWNLMMPKGTATHRLVGRSYFYVMLVVNLSVFAIYHFDIAQFRPFVGGKNTFGIFHWEAVATLFILFLGFYAAPRQNQRIWAFAHPASMLFTYYMLIGGLINELFVRITSLHSFAQAQLHSTRNVASAPIVGMTQSAALVIFAIAFIYFMIKVGRFRRAASIPAE